MPPAGRYTVVVAHAGKTLASRRISVRQPRRH
jgi:hypothetical protein